MRWLGARGSQLAAYTVSFIAVVFSSLGICLTKFVGHGPEGCLGWQHHGGDNFSSEVLNTEQCVRLDFGSLTYRVGPQWSCFIL